MVSSSEAASKPLAACRRFALRCAVALASLLALPVPAHAFGARHRNDPPPEVTHTATGTIEVGTLDDTPYRIDIPTNWNHSLVVYFHGYTESPASFSAASPLINHVQPIFDRGYAVIQSAYSTSGWALAEAYPETEELRLYFLKHYAQPATGNKAAKTMETFVVGGSMGGALVTAELELNPKPFAGGLDLCGSVGPTDLNFQRRFAWRAAFDFYFPGVLPTLVPTPVNFEESRALRLKVEAALKANPPAATALRNLTGLHTDREVAEDMVYFTFNIADLQHRAGGNPFDNRNFVYTGSNPTSTAPDNALNDGVHRYAADPRAREYLLHHYTPTGRLARPMLALHTTYDPRVPGWTLAIYAEQVAEAGFENNLVQQFVKRDGHCTFSQDEIGRAFDELTLWTRTGRRPTPGNLPSATPPRNATASAIPH